MKSLTVALLLPVLALAQQEVEHKSIHQMESELHRNDPVSVTEAPSVAVPFLPKAGRTSVLARKVYGWHPYWALTNAYMNYDYNALSHIAYFSYETDTATGGYTTIRDWNSTPIIAYAHQRGVKVALTVTNFGYDQNDKLLRDTVKQERMITTLISLLKSRSGDGVNFDLELVSNTHRVNLVSFMRRASTRIKAELPLAEISMATPAVDWAMPKTWDFAQLAQVCDYLVVMGYDYYYSGSETAGPVAPLVGENYNITRTVDTYLAAGVPRQKLFLGVPWFGHDWPVESSARKSKATSKSNSRTYVVAERMALSYGKVFDQTTKVPWFAYNNGSTWRQVWYDDSASLAMKYGLVNAQQLGGIGIWALSYDSGRTEIWSGIKSAFTPTGVETIVGEAPQRFELLQNYPNPFNPKTAISYRLPAPSGAEGLANSIVTLKVFDLLGREISTLVDEARQPGFYTVHWDASAIPSGVYFYRLRAWETSTGRGRSFIETRRMTLLR